VAFLRYATGGTTYTDFTDFSSKKTVTGGDCDVGKKTSSSEIFHNAATCADTRSSLGEAVPGLPATVVFRFQAVRGVSVDSDVGLDDISITHDCYTHAAALAVGESALTATTTVSANTFLKYLNGLVGPYYITATVSKRKKERDDLY
jgi:hypothetical protein